MWESTGRFVLKFRIVLLLILAASTAYMAWHASKVELSNEFARAIPLDNIKYIQYQAFKSKFGEDGNLMVIGIQTDHLFTDSVFNDYKQLNETYKKLAGIEDVLSVTAAINLVKNDSTEKLIPTVIFPAGPFGSKSN